MDIREEIIHNFRLNNFDYLDLCYCIVTALAGLYIRLSN